MPIALITGASRGFGRALARELGHRGWALVLDARDPTALAIVGEELREAGIAVRTIAGDVTDASHQAELVVAAKDLGGLDLLVHNASSLGPSPLPDLERYPLDELRRVMEVNVFAPLALTQQVLPMLRESTGTAIAISSDAAVEAYEGWGGYGSSKAALDQLWNVLAQEQPELRVYSFDPGDMRTDMHQAAFPNEDISDRPLPEVVVPALIALLDSDAPSARYRASDWSTS